MSYDHKDEVQYSIRSTLSRNGYVQTANGTWEKREQKTAPHQAAKAIPKKSLLSRMVGFFK